MSGGNELFISGNTVNVPMGNDNKPKLLDSNIIEEILSTSYKQYTSYMLEPFKEFADKHGNTVWLPIGKYSAEKPDALRPFGDKDPEDLDGDNDTEERVTFSEGVAYVMMRALWANDRKTFHLVWRWAQANLQRKNIKKVFNGKTRKWQAAPQHINDHLFAWRWHPDVEKKGSPGGVVVRPYDKSYHGASDADLDIAASLYLASKKWPTFAGKNNYKREALAIINDCWEKYVIQRGSKHYLVAGDHFRASGRTNPSYMRPWYFEKVFPEMEQSLPKAKRHPWEKLVKTSYEIIKQSGKLTLPGKYGKKLANGKIRSVPETFKGVNLPSYWLNINSKGQLYLSRASANDTGQIFGNDSFRTLFFVAQHFAETRDKRAAQYLHTQACKSLKPGKVSGTGPYCFLKSELANRGGKLLGGYNHDGRPITLNVGKKKNLDEERYTTYGGYLPYFYFSGDLQATQQVIDRLQGNFYNPAGFWKSQTDYYGQNWAWLAWALINRSLLNSKKPLKEETSLSPNLPTVFRPKSDHTPEFAPDFKLRKEYEIKEAVDRENFERKTKIKRVGRAAARGYKDAITSIREGRLTLFREYGNLFLFRRDIGNVDLETLDQALKQKWTTYERVRLAFILLSGLDKANPLNSKLLTRLKKLGFAQKLKLKDGKLKRSDKLAVLKSMASTPHKQSPLLQSEILFQIGLLQKTMAEAAQRQGRETKAEDLFKASNSYFAQANTLLKDLVKLGSLVENKEARGFKAKLRKDFRFISQIAPNNQVNEAVYTFGQASLLKAQLLLMKARTSNQPLAALKSFKEAYQLVQTAAQNLKGFHLSQAKQLAAEALMSAAYILKDLGPDFQKEQVASFKALLGPQYYSAVLAGLKKDSSLFDVLTATSNALLKSVLNWKEEYDQLVTQNRPNWLQEIGVYSSLWFAKLKMAQAGEKANDQVEAKKILLAKAHQETEELLKLKAILEPELVAEIKRTLGEIMVLQAYVEFTLTNKKAALEVLNQGVSQLEASFENANLTTQAEAHLWLAKANNLLASKAKTPAEEKDFLSKARKHLETDKTFTKETVFEFNPTTNTFSQREEYRLKGTVLSSAYQTYGDILSAEKDFTGAEKYYRLALGLNSSDNLLKKYLEASDKNRETLANNHEARTALADVLNWQGRYKEAAEQYNLVPEHSKIYPNAQLGLKEVAMRQGDNYSKAAIAQAEDQAKEIFKKEPAGSFLHARAIQTLFEAYRTDEGLQELIVYLGKGILGKEAFGPLKAEITAEQKEKADAILAVLNAETKSALEPAAKAQAYLSMAEALLWRKRFDEALTLIDKVPYHLRPEFEAALKQKPELRVQHSLIRAEIVMRDEETADAFLAFLKTDPLKVAIKEKDADLVARILIDHAEAYLLEEEWDKAAQVAQTPLIQQEKVRKLFASRSLSYAKFQFQLRFRLASAYIGDKEYLKAREVLEKIKVESSKTKEKLKAAGQTYLLAPYRRTEAQSLIKLGNIFSYKDWVQHNYHAAIQNYQNSIKLLNSKDNSKKGRVLKAKAHLGLGEVYRYGDDYKNYGESKKNYNQVLELVKPLSEKSEQKLELLVRAYLGLAQLEQENDHPAVAHDYFEKAKKISRDMRKVTDDLKSALNMSHQDFKPSMVSLGYSCLWENSENVLGEKTSAQESRWQVDLNIPLPIPKLSDQVILRGQYLVDDRTDHQRNSYSQVTAAYLGLSLKPDLTPILPSQFEAVLGRHLSIDIMGKLPIGKVISKDANAVKPVAFRRPDLTFGTSYWSNHIIASYALNKDWHNSKMDTHYWSLGFNFAYFNLIRRLGQLQLSYSANIYDFPYITANETSYRHKQSHGLQLNFAADPANFIPHFPLSHGRINLSGQFNFGFELEQQDDKESLLFKPGDGGPIKGQIGLSVNAGQVGKFQCSYSFLNQSAYSVEQGQASPYVYSNQSFTCQWSLAPTFLPSW